jgi:holo-[acyl-carrier protein] synthase
MAEPFANVIAHGVDLVHLARIAHVYEDHRERFLKRVFTAGEQAYALDCKDPIPRLAARFAAKEAVMKVLGTGWSGGVEWTEIETVVDPLGKPTIVLRGRTAEIAGALGIGRVLISLSHSGEYAMASAVGIGTQSPEGGVSA